MGARLEDYEQVSPYKSFIHVDQFSGPKELAEYLLELDKDDQAYNQYFQVRFSRVEWMKNIKKTKLGLQCKTPLSS